MDALHVRAHHPHHRVVVLLNGLFARHHRHGRIRHFDARIPQYPVAFFLGLNIKWIRKIRRIDELGLQRLYPIGRRSDGKPSDVALRIETVPFHHHAVKKITQRTQARAGQSFTLDVFRSLELGSRHDFALNRFDSVSDGGEVRAGEVRRHDRCRCHRRGKNTPRDERF